MSKVSLHPICIKNQYENNNILGSDTSELRFGSVQNLYLKLETRPLTEPFRMHYQSNDGTAGNREPGDFVNSAVLYCRNRNVELFKGSLDFLNTLAYSAERIYCLWCTNSESIENSIESM